MSLVDYILGGIFVIFVAIMSLRHHPNRGKSYEQKRDELYEYSQQRMEEFKATEMRPKDPEALEDESSEEVPEEAPEEGLDEDPEGEPEEELGEE